MAHCPLSVHHWGRLVEKISFARLQMKIFVPLWMHLIFGLVREGIGFLGFGGYVGMVSRLRRMNQITASRKVCILAV